MTDHRNLLAHARMLVHAAGCSVIPIAPGTKMPAMKYDQAATYFERRPTDIELAAWFGGDVYRHELGIVCGPVSGGLCVLDLDHESLWPDLKRWLPWDISHRLPVVKTERGHHIYCRMENPPGTATLAEIPGMFPLATTRGLAGWVVAPPSRHPSGYQYRVVEGSLLDIPYLSSQQAHMLLVGARFSQLFESVTTDIRIALTPTGVSFSDHDGQARTLTFQQALWLGQYLETWRGLLGRAAYIQNPPEPTVDYDAYWIGEEES